MKVVTWYTFYLLFLYLFLLYFLTWPISRYVLSSLLFSTSLGSLLFLFIFLYAYSFHSQQLITTSDFFLDTRVPSSSLFSLLLATECRSE